MSENNYKFAIRELHIYNIIMKTHNGMRPQDVVILLQLHLMNSKDLFFADISRSLNISASEVSESLERSRLARLVSDDKHELYKASFLEFLLFGLKYVFPASPGAMVRGLATAHSAPPLNSIIISQNDLFVWATPKGTVRGQSIIPLYKTVPEASLKDSRLYELLALADAIRVGRAREVNIATEELTKRINPL